MPALGDDERQLTLVHSLSCEPERFRDVVTLQVGIGIENLGTRHPVSDHRDNGRDRNAKPSDAWHTAHLPGIDRDASEFHFVRLSARGSDYSLRPQRHYLHRAVPQARQDPVGVLAQ